MLMCLYFWNVFLPSATVKPRVEFPDNSDTLLLFGDYISPNIAKYWKSHLSVSVKHNPFTPMNTVSTTMWLQLVYSFRPAEVILSQWRTDCMMLPLTWAASKLCQEGIKEATMWCLSLLLYQILHLYKIQVFLQLHRDFRILLSSSWQSQYFRGKSDVIYPAEVGHWAEQEDLRTQAFSLCLFTKERAQSRVYRFHLGKRRRAADQ